MSPLSRRQVLSAGAWSVPVIAAAIASPAAAVSQPTVPGNAIRFTNLTARVGKAPNTVYVNTKVQVVDGPTPVQGLVVTITLTQGEKVFRHTQETPHLPGWGGAPIFMVEQGEFVKGAPVEVFFTATANDVEMITGHVLVEAPGWWL